MGVLLGLIIGVLIVLYTKAPKKVVCKNCGYCGTLVKKHKGNELIGILLLLCFIVPGIIYFIWSFSNRNYQCPSCSSLNVIPANSPIGTQLIDSKKLGTKIEQSPVTGVTDDIKFGAFIVACLFLLFFPIIFSSKSNMHDNETKDIPKPTYPISVTQKNSRAIAKASAKPSARTKKANWYVIMMRQCMRAEGPPETYIKRYPKCGILDTPDADDSLVFVKCNLETKDAGENIPLNLIFGTSKQVCETALKKIQSMESESY